MPRSGRSVIYILWLWAYYSGHSWADNCAPSAVSVRIGNVSLSNGQVTRGVDIAIGDPPQNASFLPQIALNNTYIYGSDGFCTALFSGWKQNACITFRGGMYDQSKSQSWGAVNASEPSPYAFDNSDYPNRSEITEKLHLGSEKKLLNFPLGLAQNDNGRQGYQPQMGLGLGPNSTFLRSLFSAGLTPSRSWGYFWGLSNSQISGADVDGNLVLGGYDQAKVTGQGYTLPLSPGISTCRSQMLVSISDISLIRPNGVTVSIFPEEQNIIQACIEISYPSLMTIPLDPYFSTLQKVSKAKINERSKGLYWYNNRYDDNSVQPWDGMLDIKLSCGLKVRIRNSQLIVPDTTIDAQTGALKANSSPPDITMLALQGGNAGDRPILGRMFFTAAYLFLNQAKSEFTLWSAVPVERQEIVSVDSNGNVFEPACSSSGDPVSAGEAFSPSSTSLGPIIGGSVGGGLVLFAVVAWAFHRYWKKKQRLKREAEHATNANRRDSSENKLGGDNIFKDKPDSPVAPVELEQKNRIHELNNMDGPKHELPVEEAQVELGGEVVHELEA